LFSNGCNWDITYTFDRIIVPRTLQGTSAATCHVGASPKVQRTYFIAYSCRRLTRIPLSFSEQHGSPVRNVNPIRCLFQATWLGKTHKYVARFPFPHVDIIQGHYFIWLIQLITSRRYSNVLEDGRHSGCGLNDKRSYTKWQTLPVKQNNVPGRDYRRQSVCRRCGQSASNSN
jgi:hypothetical protein